MSGPCCVDPGAKQSHTAQGNETKVGEFNTYKIGQGKSAILVFTDIFGYSFINTRKLADTFAQETGTTVLIPDFFEGDPMDPTDPNLLEKLPDWLKKHPVDKVLASLDKFMSTIKGHYDTIQAIGFCYGGKMVVHLIMQAQLDPAVKAVVAAHASFLVKEEAAQIKRPILFQLAGHDDFFSPDLREHFEKTLAPTHLANFIDYPGTVHGFVTRPDGSEHGMRQRDKAVHDAVEYFKKNL